MRRAAILLVLIGVLAVAAPARANLWTRIDTGVVAPTEIDALEYQGPDRIWLGTSDGAIRSRVGGAFVVQAAVPAVRWNEIAFQPAGGVIGLAVGATTSTISTGKLYRFDGVNWAEVSLAGSSYSFTCGASGAYAPATPTVALRAVAWLNTSVAYVIGGATGMVLRTDDAGLSWRDVSRRPDGSCRLPDLAYDIAVSPPSSSLAFVTTTGRVYTSADGLATPAVKRIDAACGAAQERRIVFRAAELLQTTSCDGASGLLGSADSGVTFAALAGGGDMGTGMLDVDSSGSTALAAGGGDGVIVSLASGGIWGRPVGGTPTAWKEAELASPTSGAVAGGTALAIAEHLELSADTVAPTAALTGADAHQAPTTLDYSAAVADEPGGSGLDPASLVWRVDNVLRGSGAALQYRFTTLGNHAVRFSFADVAGNAGSVTKTVAITADNVRPRATVSLSQPVIRVGDTVTFTLNATDSTLGSGALPAAAVWTKVQVSKANVRLGVGPAWAFKFTKTEDWKITVVVNDAAGNATTVTKIFEVLPALKVRQPSIAAPKPTTRRRGRTWTPVFIPPTDFGMPAGVPARQGCKGDLRLRYLSGSRSRLKTLGSGQMKLKVSGGECSFSGTVRLRSSMLRKKGTVYAVIAFKGNKRLRATQACRSQAYTARSSLKLARWKDVACGRLKIPR